jgi:hypothetical protein
VCPLATPPRQLGRHLSKVADAVIGANGATTVPPHPAYDGCHTFVSFDPYINHDELTIYRKFKM